METLPVEIREKRNSKTVNRAQNLARNRRPRRVMFERRRAYGRKTEADRERKLERALVSGWSLLLAGSRHASQAAAETCLVYDVLVLPGGGGVRDVTKGGCYGGVRGEKSSDTPAARAGRPGG